MVRLLTSLITLSIASDIFIVLEPAEPKAKQGEKMTKIIHQKQETYKVKYKNIRILESWNIEMLESWNVFMSCWLVESEIISD